MRDTISARASYRGEREAGEPHAYQPRCVLIKALERKSRDETGHDLWAIVQWVIIMTQVQTQVAYSTCN
jgi:hypothetical protein